MLRDAQRYSEMSVDIVERWIGVIEGNGGEGGINDREVGENECPLTKIKQNCILSTSGSAWHIQTPLQRT